MSLKSWLSHGKEKESYSKIPNYEKYQLDLLKQMTKGKGQFDFASDPQYQQSQQGLQQASGYYNDLMSPDSQAYQNFAAPQMQQFQQEIVPGIAERFSGMGAGAQSSSAFNQTMAQEGGNLQMRLAQLRSSLQMQGAEGLTNLSQQQFNMSPYQMMMKRAQAALGVEPFALEHHPAQRSRGQKILSAYGNSIVRGAQGFAAGGPAGAVAGGAAGMFEGYR